MKISKKVEYGLRAMLYLAKAQLSAKNKKTIKPISLKEISKKEKISFDFLEKIFSQLEKANLVKSKKGSLGGYFLAKPANKITPGHIVIVLEETVAQAHCFGCPNAGGCTSENVWNEAQQSLDDSLNSITLAQIIKKK